MAISDTSIQASATVLADGTTLEANGAQLRIKDNGVSGAKIAMGSDAQGDILYYNGTDYARLPASTAGLVLKTNGAGANPSWASAGNCVLIEQKVLGAEANVVTFSSIASGYKRLMLQCEITGDGGDLAPTLTFNNDGTALYNSVRISCASSTVSGATITGASSQTLITGNGFGTGTKAYVELEVSNSSSHRKNYKILSIKPENATELTNIANFTGFYSSNTEISRIDLTASGTGSIGFASGSIFTLWGFT